MADLTAFQYDVLSVLRNADETHGLGIKRELEQHYPKYNQDVNHGRLYPNLDELVEMGFVEKGEIDDRTNSYALSPDGLWALNERMDELQGNYGDSE